MRPRRDCYDMDTKWGLRTVPYEPFAVEQLRDKRGDCLRNQEFLTSAQTPGAGR